MRLAGIVVGLVIALSGAVWMLQGLNAAFVPQSFMTSSRQWLLIGGLSIVAGCGLAAWSWKRR